jgi:hypothetical protein
VCVCTHSTPSPPESRQLTAIRPLAPTTLCHVNPLKACLGSMSPSNLSALRQLSVYNADLGYHHIVITAESRLSWLNCDTLSPPPIPLPHDPVTCSQCSSSSPPSLLPLFPSSPCFLPPFHILLPLVLMFPILISPSPLLFPLPHILLPLPHILLPLPLCSPPPSFLLTPLHLHFPALTPIYPFPIFSQASTTPSIVSFCCSIGAEMEA